MGTVATPPGPRGSDSRISPHPGEGLMMVQWFMPTNTVYPDMNISIYIYNHIHIYIYIDIRFIEVYTRVFLLST